MGKAQSRKEWEAEFEHLGEIVRQHPKAFEHAFLEFQRLWVKELKVREPWVCGLPDTRPYQSLLHLLYTAQDTKDDPILQQALAVCGAIEFLTESNFPSALIKPLRDLRGELLDLHARKRLKGKPGARPMPHNAAVAATLASAAVTVLKKGRGVAAALELVSKAAELDKNWLREFRKNLQRGIGNHALNYRTNVASLQGASTEQVLNLFRKPKEATC